MAFSFESETQNDSLKEDVPRMLECRFFMSHIYNVSFKQQNIYIFTDIFS